MDQKYDIADPNPDALIESLRSFGYTPSTAIADLIDNRITADASNIDIRTRWDGARSWISILDGGGGMDEQTLVSAMRVGSQHPCLKRADHDLGRWGLGLKTASRSTSRSSTVITKEDGMMNGQLNSNPLTVRRTVAPKKVICVPQITQNINAVRTQGSWA